MKKFLLGTVGLIALGMAAPATAADLAARPYTKAPPPVIAPIYDWTGFYIGGNGGWGQSNSCLNFVDAFGFDFADGCRSRSGGLIGGQVGYRWQASQWVFGLEAQGDWADLSNQRISLINPLFSTRTQTDAIGLFTGQIGYAWNQALFYVKGGAAVTSNRFSVLDTLTGFEFASASATRWGGTAGVGFEYGFAPNWSFGVEYNHLWMGDANNTFTGLTIADARFLRQPDHPRRGYGHLAHQLPLRRLRRTNRSEILTSSNYIVSSKVGRQKCRPILLERYMSEKPVRPATRPQSSARQAAADLINQAFEKSDVAEICHAIGAATRLYNISDLAQKSGLARPSLHRAFAGDPIKPNFTTVFNVLDAMGFQLHVTVRRGAGAARLKSVKNFQDAVIGDDPADISAADDS